ncbi:MAG: SpoIIE family protein phosphatase [Candidatus Xenobia bacterium]
MVSTVIAEPGILEVTPGSEDAALPFLGVLESADRLILFTDGVPDTRNAASEFYGVKRLQNLLERHPDASPARMVDAIPRSLAAFRGSVCPQADIAVLILAPTPDRRNRSNP